MMPTLVEQIELHLRNIISNSPNGVVEISRAEMAIIFGCVPSQINYVLGTRFTPERGFVVETRRGGGGYVRISRHLLQQNQILTYMQGCSEDDSLNNFILRLHEEGFLTKRETSFISEMLKTGIDFEKNQKEVFNSQIVKALTIFLKEE